MNRISSAAKRIFFAFEAKISPSSLLGLTASILLLGLLLSATQMIIDSTEIRNREICFRTECTTEFLKLITDRIAPLLLAANVAFYIATIAVPYIALRSYLSTTTAQAFGNQIAHLGFFERFMSFEIGKRDRISPSCVDIYRIYRTMFPKGGGNHASQDFLELAHEVRKVIEKSNTLVSEAGEAFKFEIHRRQMIAALRSVGITTAPTPRIDFLETEGQLVELLGTLVWVFGDHAQHSFFPPRLYR